MDTKSSAKGGGKCDIRAAWERDKAEPVIEAVNRKATSLEAGAKESFQTGNNHFPSLTDTVVTPVINSTVWGKIGANRDKGAGLALQFIEPEVIDKGKGVKYTEAEVENELKKWEFGVVGYVMGVNPSLK